MLKLIIQHSPTLRAFLCGLHLRLSKPQFQPVLRLADALIVSAARHKTSAGLYRLLVDTPDPSTGADTLRISPWTAEDLRAPRRHFIRADVVAYAHQSDNWPLYVSLADSLDEQDQGTRHLEAVEYHHDHTKSHGKKSPTTPVGPCVWKSAWPSAPGPMPMIGGSPCARRRYGVSTGNGALRSGSAFARKRRSDVSTLLILLANSSSVVSHTNVGGCCIFFALPYSELSRDLTRGGAKDVTDRVDGSGTNGTGSYLQNDQ